MTQGNGHSVVATSTPPRQRREQERETVARTVGTVSGTEAMVGAGATALAVLGLAGVLPTVLCAVATMTIGVALLIEGGGIVARYRELADLSSTHSRAEATAGGLSAEMLGGVTGIALGLLALIGLASWTLMAIGAIVFGFTHIVGVAAVAEVETRAEPSTGYPGITAAGGSARILVGLGAATLGILALAGVGATATLVLVSMLALGAAILLSGSALGARMARLAR